MLLNPETVGDTAGFGTAPTPPVGIDLVIVNGTVMVEDGVISRERAGLVLLRGS